MKGPTSKFKKGSLKLIAAACFVGAITTVFIVLNFQQNQSKPTDHVDPFAVPSASERPAGSPTHTGNLKRNAHSEIGTNVLQVTESGTPVDDTYAVNSSSEADRNIAYQLRLGKLTDPADFSNSDLTDDGLRLLSTVKALHRFNLSSTNITDNGVAYLRNKANVNILDLNNNKKVTDASGSTIGSLRGVLESTKGNLHLIGGLCALYMEHDNIGGGFLSNVYQGALDSKKKDLLARKEQSLLQREEIGEWQTHGINSLAKKDIALPLTELDLRNTRAKDEDLKILPTLTPALKELDVGGDAITDAGLMSCTQLHYLIILDLSGTKVTDDALLLLSKCHDLRDVNLSDTRISAMGIGNLVKSCPFLRRLYLNHVDISDNSIDEILKLKQLEHLDLRNTQVSDAGMLKLAKCKTLMDVSVDGSSVTASGLENFKRSRTNAVVVHEYMLEHLPVWLAPDKTPAINNADAHLATAKVLLGSGKYRLALLECNRALMLFDNAEVRNRPSFLRGQTIKAQCLVKVGRRSEAEWDARKFRSLGDNSAAAAIEQGLKSEK